MDDVTLQALKDSIAKWEKNSRVRKIENVRMGSDECALCLMFYSKECSGCPVSEATSFTCCEGTPFVGAYQGWEDWCFEQADGKAFRKAARAEVDFLKSLLPEG